jgi:hypothetical protein
VITNYREPVDTDILTVTLGSGNETTMTVRQAINAGFLGRNNNGKLFEVDRAAQQQTVAEIERLEKAQKESEQFTFTHEAEQAVHEMATAMHADGLDFSNSLASFIGSDGAHVDEVTARWAGEQGLDMQRELRTYMDHLKACVTEEVLAPQGIDPESFLQWITDNGLVRARATRATLYAHNMKSLNGFKSLAREFLDSGGRARQRRG